MGEQKRTKKQSKTYIVLGSLVQSGLLSKFDKTGTETGPHRVKNLEKLD